MRTFLSSFAIVFGLTLVFHAVSTACVSPDGADPQDQVLQPCPEQFGGPSVVRCFKNECNWCVVHGGDSGLTSAVECNLAACGK